MAALLHDILLLEEHALVEVGVEELLHFRVREIYSPAHEVVNSLLRAVGIIDFQPVSLRHHVVTHFFQGCGGLFGKECRRFLVAVNAGSYEVVCAVIANLQDGIGHGFAEGYKLAAVIGRTDHRIVVFTAAAGYHTCAANNDEDGGEHPKFLLFHIQITLQSVELRSNHLTLGRADASITLHSLTR